MDLPEPDRSEFKCVVVGDGGVGKTSMLLRFVQGHFLTEYSPTHFDSYKVSLTLSESCYPLELNLIDTAGQETYDRLRTLTYYDTDVFILCFSVINRDSLINIRSRWQPELTGFKPKTPIVLVGTQTDLRDKQTNFAESSISSSIASSENVHQFVSRKEGKRLANKIGAVKYLECSSLTGDGLEEIFSQALLASALPRKKKKRFWKSLRKMFGS